MNKVLTLLLIFFIGLSCSAEVIKDEVADLIPRPVVQPLVHKSYNYESVDKVPIQIKVLNEIKSEKDIYEGQIIEFKVIKDIVYKDKVIAKRGDIVTAQVGIIITSGMNGIPASIIFKDFDINGIKRTKLTNSYEIQGQNRSLLVFPLKWAFTIIPPTGSLTNLIMGGHAKLKKKQIITIYYYPEWI